MLNIINMLYINHDIYLYVYIEHLFAVFQEYNVRKCRCRDTELNALVHLCY